MKTYAGAKSKTASPSLKPLKGPPPELSDDEKEVIADRVRIVQKHLPEAWSFMKGLQKEGLIDGMRCLLSATVFEEVNHGSI